MAKTKYPRTLYKSPGTQVFVSKREKHTYDSLVVNNEKEHDTAVEMGYIDSFFDAVYNMPKVKAEEQEDALQEEGF